MVIKAECKMSKSSWVQLIELSWSTDKVSFSAGIRNKGFINVYSTLNEFREREQLFTTG